MLARPPGGATMRWVVRRGMLSSIWAPGEETRVGSKTVTRVPASSRSKPKQHTPGEKGPGPYSVPLWKPHHKFKLQKRDPPKIAKEIADPVKQSLQKLVGPLTWKSRTIYKITHHVLAVTDWDYILPVPSLVRLKDLYSLLSGILFPQLCTSVV